MQFVWLGGLPTYVASNVVDLSKIHVIIESKLPPPKKPKKIMTYIENVEMCGLLNSHG
jgi:hypothetical protein